MFWPLMLRDGRSVSQRSQKRGTACAVEQRFKAPGLGSVFAPIANGPSRGRMARVNQE